MFKTPVNDEDTRKQVVLEKLSRYQSDPFDCSAGYDILRYAKMGWLTVKVE
jgi:hypothetical protein